MRKRLLAIGFATSLVTGSNATAAPCAGFTDLDDSSSFCENVQWIKNRGVTTGCHVVGTPARYCPNEPVIRLQMAAFMNRLGNALQPVFLHASDQAMGPTIISGGVACQTAPYPVTGYPRVATATASLVHVSAGQQTVTARIAYSIDGGPWTNHSDVLSYATNPAGGVVSQTMVTKAAVFQPGQSITFGIFINAAPNINNAQCELQARLESQTGAGAPFDEGR